LKFVALPVPEIIGGTQKKIEQSLQYARAPYSPKFLIGFCSDGPNLKFVALPIPELLAIAVLGWGCEPPILGKRRP